MRLNRLSSTHSEPGIHALFTTRGPGLDRHRFVVSITHFASRHRRLLSLCTLALLAFPIWVSIGDHGFNGRSDARYAVVSQEMARSGDWIVPRYLGRVHLTKPPLVYWFESISLDVFGHSFYAVRFPSALSGTLALLVLFGFARKVAGDRVALFATGLYAIMPLTIFPARMTVTDSLVNLLWMSIVFSGFLSAKLPSQRRWTVLFWTAAALGMLAKGPVLLIPIGMTGLWWFISGSRPFSARGIGALLGCLALAMLPTLAWATAVYLSAPGAVGIWWHETFDRAVGAGDHARPLWFFVPILLAGCFPASAMLLLPGINFRFRQIMPNLRGGRLPGFLGWSIVVPFVIFSLISGKLPSYIMPVCAPLALLSAMMLENWFAADSDGKGRWGRLPEVRYGLFIGTMLFILAMGAAVWVFYEPKNIIWMYGMIAPAIVSVVLVLKWRDVRFRSVGIGLFILGWVLGWGALEELEDIVLSQMSYVSVAQKTFGQAGWTGREGVYQLEDGIIYWDREGELERFDTPAELVAGLDHPSVEPILILTTAIKWDQLKETNNELYRNGTIMSRWRQWPGAPVRYLVVCTPILPSGSIDMPEHD